MTTRWEVETALETVDMEPTGRHILLRLLTRAVVATAEIPVQHAPTFDELAAITGYSRSAIAEWMKALGAAGWVCRTAAAQNVKSGYRLTVGARSVALPKRESRAKRAVSRSPLSGPDVDAESREIRRSPAVIEGSVVRSADQTTAGGSPLSGPDAVRSADQSSPLSGPEATPSPITSSLTLTNPDRHAGATRVPSPRPTDEVLNWSIANDQSQRRTGSINPPKTGRQSALFAAKDVKLTEREQIVRDWLQANDYPSDPAFVKDVAVKVQRAFTGKSLGYLRGVAAPTGSGFGPFAEAVRQERGEATEKAIRALEDSEPACEHGTLAGRALHPTHQHLICPQCRIGAPARPAASETRPAVAAALAAYRSAWRGLPLTVTQVIEFTQQAEALHSGGVPAQQLADLAHLAASHGIRLIAAATRKDHAS